MNFLKIAGRDIGSIFKNRFIRISIVAIIVVPLLYSLLYLDAFWDPYSRLKDMPVAIVNLDKGTVNDGSNVNYGEKLVEKLKTNTKLGWTFVTLKEAEDGINGSKYYSEFVIPEDFSKNVLSAKDGTPKTAEILYVSNDKRNFLASQINGKVQLELKNEISKGITEEYTKVAFDKLGDVKDGFNKAADVSKTLADGLSSAKTGSSKINDGITLLKNKSDIAFTKLDTKALENLINDKGTLDRINRIFKGTSMLASVNTSSLKDIKNLMTPNNMNLLLKTYGGVSPTFL